jgi:hypothetical protein
VSLRAASSYHHGVVGGAPELAQLLPQALLEQLLSGVGEVEFEGAVVASRDGSCRHRGGGFQNPTPSNPRSSPMGPRCREDGDEGGRAGGAGRGLIRARRCREGTAPWRRRDGLSPVSGGDAWRLGLATAVAGEARFYWVFVPAFFGKPKLSTATPRC